MTAFPLRMYLLSACLLALVALPASADPVYLSGTATNCAGCVFGTHLAEGASGSVAGVGGSGISSAGGSTLDGNRTYIYDLGAAAALAAGTTTRGNAGFAMMVWDFGAAYDTMRLYTHQDHYSGGPITTNFVGQDVMEYSVWGSNDNTTYVLLSDVIAFNLNGEGPGVPTYTFAGTAPTFVYRGGSDAFGILNAYTRDYTFASAYRYYGIRTSSISLAQADADPEIDAIAANQGPIPQVPEPGFLVPIGLGLFAVLFVKRRNKNTVPAVKGDA